jgi:drug/metabolite transporter (DMT)-like permease
MADLRKTAFYLTLWYAVLTAIVSVLLIALHDLGLATSLLAAASFTLLFALVLMARAGRLTEQRIARSQFWRTLPPRKRVTGEANLTLACRTLSDTWLRFAKGASAAAVALALLAYAANGINPVASAQAVQKPARTVIASGASY